MSELDFDQLVLEETTCCLCGIRFGVIKPLMELRRKDYETFYCPNGHGQHFVRPPVPRDEELENTRLTLAQANTDVRESKDEIARLTAELDQFRAGLRWWQRR